MKSILVAALSAATITAASAAEMFAGTSTYPNTTIAAEPWHVGSGTNYTTVKLVGSFVPSSGSLPQSRIECRGANFSSSEASEADGVCVFGEFPDRWVVRYHMTDRNPRVQRAERFGRRGEWAVVGSTGRFEGMTGSGTYLAAPGNNSEGGVNSTRWAGEVTIPD